MQLRKDFISNKSQKWTGRKLNYQFITIHNTGNPKSTAKGECAYLENPSNTSKTGYHIVIDEKEAIQVAPLDMIMYHAGEQVGNNTSIGIEICESGDYNKTILNAIDIVTQLLKEKGWGVDKLKQHHDWSGKDCPKLIRKGYMNWTWDKFKSEIDKKLNPPKQFTPLETLYSHKIISNINSWENWLKLPFIQGEIAKALIQNFYKFKTGKTDFIEAINYLVDNKIITSKNYWLENCIKGKVVNTEWLNNIIVRMSTQV